MFAHRDGERERLIPLWAARLWSRPV
jgi:hypothetical protein